MFKFKNCFIICKINSFNHAIWKNTHPRKYFCENLNKNNLEQDFLKLDFYSILNLNKNSTEVDIKKSYFILAKKFHPDKFKGSSEIFKKITDAYSTLRDPLKREEYNKRLKIKMRKKYKQQASDNEMNDGKENKMQDYSKYEEDFKQLNIDKLFTQFTHRKIKTSPDQIKVE